MTHSRSETTVRRKRCGSILLYLVCRDLPVHRVLKDFRDCGELKGLRDLRELRASFLAFTSSPAQP
jgi:hypothetical protein